MSNTIPTQLLLTEEARTNAEKGARKEKQFLEKGSGAGKTGSMSKYVNFVLRDDVVVLQPSAIMGIWEIVDFLDQLYPSAEYPDGLGALIDIIEVHLGANPLAVSMTKEINKGESK